MSFYKYQVDDTVDRWIKEVSGGKSHMSPKTEKSLVMTYQTTDSPTRKSRALKDLIAYNAMSLAAIVLNVYHSTRSAKKIEPVDLLQEAVTVFTHKLDGFDPNKGARLITYYTRDVRTAVQRYIASNAMDIRQGSVYLRSIASQIASVRRKHEGDTDGEKLSQEEIAIKLGISEKTIAMVEQFTTINIHDVTDNMSEVKNDNSSDYHRIFTLLEEKLSNLTADQFNTVQSCLISGKDIPLEILNLIK